ncbi:hypothetical protein GCM10029964_116940 [Kibdelosporangium lantanae]
MHPLRPLTSSSAADNDAIRRPTAQLSANAYPMFAIHNRLPVRIVGGRAPDELRRPAREETVRVHVRLSGTPEEPGRALVSHS